MPTRLPRTRAVQEPWPECVEATCRGVRMPGGERCVQHGDQEARDRFVAAVRAGGPCDLRGVAIGGGLVRALTADAKDKAPPVTFDGLQAEQAVFLDGADFSGCRFAGEVVFDGAVFRTHASFDQALFEGAARFNRVRFARGATFDEVRFAADARFGGADIGGVSFDRAQFDDVAWFEGARWRGRASFEEVSFGRVAWFAAGSFEDPAIFDRSSFVQHVSFDRAAFQKRASFTLCSFAGLAMFMDATFGGDASLDRIVAKREIRFNHSEFRREASFSDAEFNKPVWLEEVTVRRQARFENARFADQIHAAGASFEGGLWLGGAEFVGANDLGPFEAGPSLVLDGAAFHQRVRLHARAERVAAVDVRLMNGGDLRFAEAEVILDGATFGAPTSIVGLRPEGVTDRSMRLLSLRWADVTNLALVDVDLAACLFDGAHHLDHLRIEGSQSFATSPVARPPGIGWLRVLLSRRWTLRQTLAEEHRWRAGHATSHHAGGQQWNPPETRSPPWVQEYTGRPVAVVSPHRIAVIYRGLRKANEDAKDEPGAADFYYGEMEMRRHATVAPAAERLLLHLYWLVSGYGLRAWRAVVLLLAVTAVHGFLFAVFGFTATSGTEEADYGPWSGHIYALNMLLLSPDAGVELTAVGQILRTTLRVTAPVLLGLAALAVRNRVKR